MSLGMHYTLVSSGINVIKDGEINLEIFDYIERSLDNATYAVSLGDANPSITTPKTIAIFSRNIQFLSILSDLLLIQRYCRKTGKNRSEIVKVRGDIYVLKLDVIPQLLSAEKDKFLGFLKI